MPKLRWFTWVGVLGAGVAGWGLLWLALSSYVIRAVSQVEFLTSEMNPSIGSQALAVLGAISFAVAGADWLRRR